jgi:hypothetical protein
MPASRTLAMNRAPRFTLLAVDPVRPCSQLSLAGANAVAKGQMYGRSSAPAK